MTNKDRANKIKKLLGLQGEDNDSAYYRIADVICDLQHYCDYYKKHPDYEDDIDFDNELETGRFYYLQEEAPSTKRHEKDTIMN